MKDDVADASYTAYVDARWASLHRFAYLLAGSSDAADDLLQATMVDVYVKWERVSAATSIDAYVRRMMVNQLNGDGRRGGQCCVTGFHDGRSASNAVIASALPRVMPMSSRPSSRRQRV
jgi:DNA-directed RNA polymerase specialized sigma24 family protein